MADDVSKLGSFLKDRRTRLDPAALGFQTGRRRTPGLRREEVAQRANISPTWYTWLEQGRGGAPSTDVLERIAAGLMLTEPEREHLFLLAFGHRPEPRYTGTRGISPRLQHVLDAMPASPAIVKTATWDVVAWNEPAAALLTDYAKLPVEERNVLRRLFSDSATRAAQEEWRNVARYTVGAFRADATRAGASVEIARLVEDLSRTSPEFAALWRANDVHVQGEGVKRLRHPEIGLIELEFSTFAVEGRPDLSLMIFNPATAEGAALVRDLIARRAAQKAD